MYPKGQYRLQKAVNMSAGREKQFITQLPEVERIAWLWCLLIAYLVPELGTLIRSLRICFFKSCTKPTTKEFFAVFLSETLHTVGVSIFVFVILPDLDVVKGAMLTNCVCFVPGLLGMIKEEQLLYVPLSWVARGGAAG
jgi:chitin synthase